MALIIDYYDNNDILCHGGLPMSTATEIEEPKPITEFLGSFIVYFEDENITMTHEEGGFDINEGVAYISRVKFERIPGYFRITVNENVCHIDDDEIKRVEVVG